MKRYLSAIFVILSIITIYIGYLSDVRWSGIATWGLVFFFLILAAYFTKFISDKDKEKEVDR